MRNDHRTVDLKGLLAEGSWPTRATLGLEVSGAASANTSPFGDGPEKAS